MTHVSLNAGNLRASSRTKRRTQIRMHALRFLLIFAAVIACASAEEGDATLLSIVIVTGVPGHTAVHLERNGEQLYWDPGGEYGTEMQQCRDVRSSGHCGHLDGFELDEIARSRQNDVFVGDAATLVRILSVYHLDEDPESAVYTFRLTGEQGQRAWDLLYDGYRLGGDAEFNTKRLPSYCVKSVTAYLDEVGGQFDDMPRPWFPSRLGDELQRRGMQPSVVYSLNHPQIQRQIRQRRSRAGLEPLNDASG